MKKAFYYFIGNIFGIHSFRLPGVFVENLYSDAINGSLWSLNPEILCYILVPLLCGGKKRRKRVWIPIVICSCGILYELSYHTLVNIKCQNWLIVMMCFWFGACINYYQLEKYLNMQVAIILGIVISFSANNFITINILIICYIVLSLCLAEKPIFMNIIKSDINYEIYLYAWPIQQTLIYCLTIKQNISISVTEMFFLSLICVLIIGTIMNRISIGIKLGFHL